MEVNDDRDPPSDELAVTEGKHPELEERRHRTRRQADVARDEAIPHLRKVVTGAIACWAIIATVAGVALFVQEGHNTSALARSTRAVAKANTALAVVQKQQKAQRSLVLQNCIRGNSRTVSENISYASDYNVFAFVAARFLVRTKTETAKQLRITQQFGHKLRASVSAKSWSPLVNCKVSVRRAGVAYGQAPTYSFTKRKPPKSALSMKNAKLADPVGSIIP